MSTTSAASAGQPMVARTRDLDATRASLERWLPDVLGYRAVSVTDLSHPSGAGVSNETLLVRYVSRDHRGTVDGGQLVARLRSDQHQLFIDPDFRMQYDMLVALESSPIPTPRAIRFEDDPDVLGAEFYVMECIEGRVPISQPSYNVEGWVFDATDAQRRTLWEGAMAQLCAVASVDPASVAFLLRGTRGASELDVHVEYWGEMFEFASGPDRIAPPAMAHVWSWLRQRQPVLDQPRLSWGDSRIGNMLFNDDFRVAAVLDWEQASLAGPLLDLGWWLFYDRFNSVGTANGRLPGLGERAETIELWQQRTGLHADELHWYEVLAGFKMSVLTLRMATSSISLTRASPLIDRNVALELTLQILDASG